MSIYGDVAQVRIGQGIESVEVKFFLFTGIFPCISRCRKKRRRLNKVSCLLVIYGNENELLLSGKTTATP